MYEHIPWRCPVPESESNTLSIAACNVIIHEIGDMEESMVYTDSLRQFQLSDAHCVCSE